MCVKVDSIRHKAKMRPELTAADRTGSFISALMRMKGAMAKTKKVTPPCVKDACGIGWIVGSWIYTTIVRIADTQENHKTRTDTDSGEDNTKVGQVLTGYGHG